MQSASTHAEHFRTPSHWLLCPATSGKTFFTRAMTLGPALVEMTTDPAPVYPRVIDELGARSEAVIERYATDENVNGGASRVLFCAAFWPAVAA